MIGMLNDCDKRQVRRAFGAASSSYDGVAALQRTIGAQLLQDFLPARLGGMAVDIGCGTGFLTARLAATGGCEQLLAVDMALPMLQVARAKLGDARRVGYVHADMECLPFRNACVDWLVSNLAMQWSRDFSALVNELHRVAAPAGRLAFTTFGPQTLQELKAAWAAADSYAHVNRFLSAEEIVASLHAAGFAEIRVDRRIFVNHYHAPVELMRELKALGAKHVAGRKTGVTTRKQLRNMLDAYEVLRSGGMLPATFEVLFVTAVKS